MSNYAEKRLSRVCCGGAREASGPLCGTEPGGCSSRGKNGRPDVPADGGDWDVSPASFHERKMISRSGLLHCWALTGRVIVRTSQSQEREPEWQSPVPVSEVELFFVQQLFTAIAFVPASAGDATSWLDRDVPVLEAEKFIQTQQN
jgi:hypothetical protein